MSADKKRPTETFEPDVVRSLEVSGGVLAGPTAERAFVAASPRDLGNHRMVVGNVPEAPEAGRMTVDVSTRGTRSLGFDWGRSRADQRVELYSGNRLLGRYGASEVFADAPEGSAASGYVTFRSMDGTPITKAVFTSASPFEVDNVSTEPTDTASLPGDATGASSRSMHVRLGTYGAPGMSAMGSQPRLQPVVRNPGAVAGGAQPAPAAPSGPIVVPPLAASRMLGLYGAPPPPEPDVVLGEQEIQLRARLMSAYALLGPKAAIDKEALERAYAMRL
jgi:hypothetical protein